VSSPEQLADFNPPGVPPIAGEVQTTASGLRFIDERQGNGAWPTMGNSVSVHYTGWLTDGTKFDSSYDRGQPIVFPLGRQQVIPGWDEGVATMRPGGKRRLVLTPRLGYGAQGTPGGPIPPNATLIFDVELVSVG
jgi:FKBP-type peptidyl-prolyl cis-trans isomerase